jgi:uncharacterized membrane protein YphA (DoxX/SURF4 family)
MQDSPVFVIVWLVCGVASITAAVLAGRSRRWLLVGRIATGVLFIAGGSILHVINLASDGDYSGFADPAHFDWVTDTWRAVVPPNQTLLIGLLAVFEAAVGVLILSGGRRTQLGYAAVIAFYLALWLFGWIETVWCVVMLPPMIVLLRAERTVTPTTGPTAQMQRTPNRSMMGARTVGAVRGGGGGESGRGASDGRTAGIDTRADAGRSGSRG